MQRLILGSLIVGLLMGTSSHAQKKLNIVASFSILADVVQQVAGDSAEVTSLIPLNADPHSFIPAPQDLVGVSEADVVFINGVGFESGLLSTIESAGEEVNIVTVSNCVNILPLGEGIHQDHVRATADTVLADLCESHHQELGGEAANPDAVGLGHLYEIACNGDHHDDREHVEGNCDPHIWMKPENVMLWVLMIRDTLIQLDPDNAGTYKANAAAYLEELRALDNDIRGQVENLPEDQRVLVTNHETLGYFADAYGFEIVGTVITGGGSSGEPSAADLAKLIDTVNETSVAAIFTENTINSNLVEQVASETGAEVLRLYTDSLTEDASTYLDYMRYNTQTIVDGLNP